MATHKIIYWRPDMRPNEKGETYANVHMLVGYNQATIADFRKMADEVRETFPQATDDQVTGGKIFKSSRFYGHTIVAWGAYIPRGDYPGWHQQETGEMEYRW